MSRRRKSKTNGDAFRNQICGLSLDELSDMRGEITREYQRHCDGAAEARSKLDTIKAVMFEAKNGGDIGISDHAVLRYMERHKGVDVRAIRKELSELARATRLLIEGTEGHYQTNSGVVVVMPQGNVVATVLPVDGDKPQ